MRGQHPMGVNDAWRHPDRLRVPAFRMIGNIYYVGNLDVSSHLIASDEGHILIDTGFATTVQLLIESIRSLGFSEKDVKLILNTHGHEDHTGGNRRMIEATGAKSAIHRRDVETVETGTELTCGYYIYGVEEFETYDVDIPLKGGEEFRFGDAVVRIHHTPGHTPGTSSLEIPIQHHGRKLKAFLFGGPGQWTFQKIHRIQGYDGDMEDYARTLSYLKKIDVDVPIGAHPGQNRTFEKYKAMKTDPEAPNPFIDPGHWTKFLQQLQDNLDSVRSESETNH